MIISAQFKNKKYGTYGSRKYSYFCDIPDVKPGDYVRVSAGTGESVAKVAEINVPKSKIDDGILAIMKSVIAIVEDPDTNVNVTCETCGEFTPIGEGDHICGADPHKMPVSDYIPTADYCWCKGRHYTKA